jgi:hypothetical protein
MRILSHLHLIVGMKYVIYLFISSVYANIDVDFRSATT